VTRSHSRLASLWRDGPRYRLRALWLRLLARFPTTWTVRDGGHEFRFHVSSVTALDRARMLLSKERDTIEWIRSFAPGDVFWDIGANVGAYSIYAGVARKARVYAFEPAFHNFYLLNRNILLNGLHDARAFNLAFADAEKMDRIFMKTAIDGDAGVNLGQSTDCNRERFEPAYAQPILAYTIDSFIERFGADCPNHVKLDVDGLEPEIIAGASRTLADPRLRSLLIEVDESDPGNRAMVERIAAAGFRLAKSPLARYQAATFINYLFTR
jgi:FkbM family methyltransferase